LGEEEIDLQKIQSLEELRLNYNGVYTKSITSLKLSPTSLVTLKSLIICRGTELKESLIKDLEQLRNLEILCLGDIRMSNGFNLQLKYPVLKKLEVSDLFRSYTVSLDCPELSELILDGKILNANSLFSADCFFPKLTHMTVNMSGKKIPKPLNFPSLKSFRILHGSGHVDLSQLPALEEFDASHHSKFSFKANEFSNIKYINLHRCSFDNNERFELHLKNLQKLTIEFYNKHLCVYLGDLPKLESLNFNEMHRINVKYIGKNH
jgi:hypothetical protein